MPRPDSPRNNPRGDRDRGPSRGGGGRPGGGGGRGRDGGGGRGRDGGGGGGYGGGRPGGRGPSGPPRVAGKAGTRFARPANRPSEPARERVFSLIANQADRFPDLDLLEPDVAGLPDRDAALLHAIYDITIKRWITIEHLLHRHLTKDWSRTHPAVKAALMVGAAQLVFMDRIPPHAAVSQSVGWARERVTPRAGGLVNAVLRQVSELVRPGANETTRGGELPPPEHRDTWTDAYDELPLPGGGAIVLHAPDALPSDPIERLAVATSHPVALLRAWMKTMPLRDVRTLAHHNVTSPPIICNTQHATAPLPESLVPHTAPGHHVFTGGYEELTQLLRSRDDIWVQDPASSLAVGSVIDLKPGLVIDPCAGQGTKTRQLTHAFPEAKVVATDVDRGRRGTLRSVFRDHPRVETPAYEELIGWAGKADLILLDVPCSNTGVLGRRAEARYRFSPKRTEELTSMQRQIVADSLRLLAPSGRILYSTCSLDPEENESIVAWAAKWHHMEVLREHRRHPEGGPGQPPERYTDGSYAGLLG